MRIHLTENYWSSYCSFKNLCTSACAFAEFQPKNRIHITNNKSLKKKNQDFQWKHQTSIKSNSNTIRLISSNIWERTLSGEYIFPPFKSNCSSATKFSCFKRKWSWQCAVIKKEQVALDMLCTAFKTIKLKFCQDFWLSEKSKACRSPLR